MPTRPKGPEIDQQKAVEQGSRRQIPGTPGLRKPGDALEPSGDVNPEKLKQNQTRLRVGQDHKTPEMKKGKRGTFP